MQNIQWDDKEKLTDALGSEKLIGGIYNNSVFEAATPEVRSVLSELLSDTQSLAQEIFSSMSDRGLYKTEKADESKLGQARTKYTANV